MVPLSVVFACQDLKATTVKMIPDRVHLGTLVRIMALVCTKELITNASVPEGLKVSIVKMIRGHVHLEIHVRIMALVCTKELITNASV